ncbi:crossover junction endonuclease MUS81 isoform X1 [Lates japonicus]|uniref:Crossover junction endonuclease MUS81 n=1 Tax=Lates japonicus TaxID=270547 RepID=A0AAD3RML0_LATJO|nr:crossover junction endonuclease MUS81 isoform X1 [Lates japonicus]
MESTGVRKLSVEELPAMVARERSHLFQVDSEPQLSGAGPRLHYREEEDGRPVWGASLTDLQGTEVPTERCDTLSARLSGGGCGATFITLGLPETTLQAMVVDGFFVKRVQDVRESAAYLTVMTRYLTKLYQNRTLLCRSRELEGDEGTGEEERGNPSCSLISFAEFNHGAVKNKCQTVREVFARQLMQISGLSGDKAAAILEQYSTPHSLLSAYEQCRSEAEKEKLLSSIRYGKLKRNLGPALSRTVYQLYCTQGALT